MLRLIVDAGIETPSPPWPFTSSSSASSSFVFCIPCIGRGGPKEKIDTPRPVYRMIIAPPNTPQFHALAPPMSAPSALDPMDLSALERALPVPSRSSLPTSTPIPTMYCANCNLRYAPEWYHHEPRRCFFCMRFRSPQVTRYALLYETPWYFIQSGEAEPHDYYTTYFALLHRWADQRRLPFTTREAEYQEYLWLMIRD